MAIPTRGGLKGDGVCPFPHFFGEASMAIPTRGGLKVLISCSVLATTGTTSIAIPTRGGVKVHVHWFIGMDEWELQLPSRLGVG